MSNSFCAFGVSFGYGGPKRQASGPELVSTNQLPVRSNGAFGRGFARFSGASALRGSAGGAAAWPAPCAINAADDMARTAAQAAAIAVRPRIFMTAPKRLVEADLQVGLSFRFAAQPCRTLAQRSAVSERDRREDGRARLA